MENHFEILAQALKPEAMMTITARIGSKKYQHPFLADTDTKVIEEFLRKRYKGDCGSWEH